MILDIFHLAGCTADPGKEGTIEEENDVTEQLCAIEHIARKGEGHICIMIKMMEWGHQQFGGDYARKLLIRLLDKRSKFDMDELVSFK